MSLNLSMRPLLARWKASPSKAAELQVALRNPVLQEAFRVVEESFRMGQMLDPVPGENPESVRERASFAYYAMVGADRALANLHELVEVEKLPAELPQPWRRDA